ncbi:MAG: MraY family glycosyltransferase [Planctomycetaceae bacterium]
MIWFIAACVVPAFVVSLLATGLMRGLAPRWGLIDRPAARKVHTTPTPLGGGIGIYLGFLLPVAAVQVLAWWLGSAGQRLDWLPPEIYGLLPGFQTRSGMVWMLIAAGTLLSAAGLLDDLRPVPWPPRMLLQFCVASSLVAGGIRATVFVDHPWVGAVLTVLWIVGLINSMNFLDNMDCLSGGIGLIASLLVAVVMLFLTSEPRWLVSGAMLTLAGSLAGFLVHNRSPARIFMGDSGSTFLGLMLASLTVLGTFYDESAPGRHVMLAPLCILAVPLYDTFSVVWIRLRRVAVLSARQIALRIDSASWASRARARSGRYTSARSRRDWGHCCCTVYTTGPAAAIIVTLVLCVLAIVSVLETAGRRREKSAAETPAPANSTGEGGSTGAMATGPGATS